MATRISEELISVREAARECGRNMETVRRWIWAGKLPAEKLGNQLFIRRGDLTAFCRKLSKQEAATKSDFLQRAILLRNRIRARTGTEFDIAALIKQSRERHLV
ncbi:helix-turn-helix domain-containing protein [Dehalococcoidales bacterium]|nr:helix-turn-helix domain-containing protein [Dehalococcoidales bacterium]